MRELHVLGVSEDGATLLLGTSKNATKPTHRIPLDERLRTAARGQMAPFGSDRAESELTPKEMQARLREGASVEEVAKAAGVPVARVLPYFVPVEAERTRIVDEARAARMHRHRGPSATRPLGQAVDTHLQEVTGLKPESVAWTARRRRDGSWVVSVSYAARGRRKAEWLWQPAGREVTPLDSAAGRLGSDPVAAPKRKAAAAPAKPVAAKKTAKKAAAKKAATPKKAVAKKAAPKPGAAARKSAPPKKAVATRPAAKRAVATKPVVKKVAVKQPPVVKKAAAAKKAPAVTKAPPAKVIRPRKVIKARKPRVVPTPAPEVEVEEGPFYAPAVIKLPVVPVAEPVEDVVEEAAAMVEEQVEASDVPAAKGRRKGERVPLPSWSDVLLGVTRDESRRSG